MAEVSRSRPRGTVLRMGTALAIIIVIAVIVVITALVLASRRRKASANGGAAPRSERNARPGQDEPVEADTARRRSRGARRAREAGEPRRRAAEARGRRAPVDRARPASRRPTPSTPTSRASNPREPACSTLSSTAAGTPFGTWVRHHCRTSAIVNRTAAASAADDAHVVARGPRRDVVRPVPRGVGRGRIAPGERIVAGHVVRHRHEDREHEVAHAAGEHEAGARFVPLHDRRHAEHRRTRRPCPSTRA